MECRQLEITLVSAQNLKNVRQIFKNRVRVYARISLGGNPRTEKRTPVDKEGQTNPVWNFTAVYTVGKNAVKSHDIKLLVQFFCLRTSGETNIGEVSVSLAELFDRFSALSEGEGAAKVNYPVKREDADSQGEVSLSYKFGDLFHFLRPPTDWGKVCWKGTKLFFKGGMLCARIALLAGGNVFDVPIDAMVDVAYTSIDILSCIFGAGDFLADIPLGDADLLTDISSPGTDVPVVMDTSSSLQSNEFVGRNLTADDLSIPSAAIQNPVDVTSCIETDIPTEVPFLGKDVLCSIDVPTDGIDVLAVSNMLPLGEADLPVDISCSADEIPLAEDATSNLQTNVDEEGMNVPSDSSMDVLAESNILSDVLCIPLGVTDFQPVGISCPAADIPLTDDATSSLQTNVYEGSDVADDNTSVPTDSANAYLPMAKDATSTVQTDAFGGSTAESGHTNLRAEPNNMSTDNTSAETDLVVDVLCSILPTAGRDARDDATSSVETNACVADVPFSEGDHAPTAVDTTSRAVSMDANFSAETNVADTSRINMITDTPCLEADGWEDATFIIGENTGETSCLQQNIRVDDTSDAETNKIDDVPSLEANAEQVAIANGEAMEDIPCLGVVEVNDASVGETNKTAEVLDVEDGEKDAIADGETMEDIPCLERDTESNGASNGNTVMLEGDVKEDANVNCEIIEVIPCSEGEIEEDAITNGEAMLDIPCLEEDVGEDLPCLEEAVAEDILCLEEEVKVNDTVIGGIKAIDCILGLISGVRDIVNYLRAKLRLITILFLILFMLPILISFLMYLWFTN